jgi:uncharacterized membrane protein YgdD (TMEM256/DUF423 family)
VHRGFQRVSLPVRDASSKRVATHARWRRRIAVAAGVLGALAVASGAFGAHALAPRLSPRMLEVWSTASRYQMWHALALLALCGFAPAWNGRAAVAAGACWIAGTVVFSGSLYLLAVTGYGALGALAPFGGVALMAGWVLVAVAAMRGDAPAP